MNETLISQNAATAADGAVKMDYIRRQLDLVREQIDLALFLEMLAVSLAAAFFASLLYRFFYERRGTGSQIHRAFPLLALAVTTLFVGVQVSIPLSLGLLGSLSIIRFRTPVKEPEEVGFVMLVIASAICAATRNFVFVLWLFAFATAAVLAQRLASASKVFRRDGLIVLSLPDAEAAAKAGAIRKALDAALSHCKLESAASHGGVTTWQYVFTGLKAEGEAFQAELAKTAAFSSVNIFLDRPGGIR
ncbi:MAG: DUF4956 domain-containing protein [Kiritimatiellae bacterium]|nr:DUF4956 domain-containing protein [Kiritimatiellia bacterium]